MLSGGTGEQLELVELTSNTPQLKVAKSNALVEANFELTVQEHKLMLLAMANIRKSQECVKDQVFRVRDLTEYLGLNPQNAYRDLNRISKNLMKKQLEIRNEESGEWALIQWVSRAWCAKGDFGIKFSEDLQPHIVGLVNRYTLYELGVILNLTSHYAIRLYEMLKQYEKIGSRTVTLEPKLTKDRKWEPFHQLMGYNPKTYARFSNLRQRVLDPAINQVIAQTEFKDLKVDYIRFQRRIVALTFTFSSNLSAADLSSHPLYRDMKAIGVPPQTIKNVLSQYNEDLIASNLNYTKQTHRERELRNPPGFFMDALKNDYAGNGVEAKQHEMIEDTTGEDSNEPSQKPDHPLYEVCTNELEFRRVLQAEKERGEPFLSYNEFHAYCLESAQH